MLDQPPNLTYVNIETFAKLRREQFSRLDESHHVYLDHTGSALYPQSLPQQHISTLQTSVLGNPHSAGAPSVCATSHVSTARRRILQFFNADPDEYDVVFTPNASGGAKIVGECFPFMRGSTLLLMSDNHNSVVGMREFARAKHASVKYVPLEQGTLRAKDALEHLHRQLKHGGKRPSLFAFPAQSNFSGVRHPLSLCRQAKRKGWYVFLDAAAYAPTSFINLSEVDGVDFMIVSFYKMFGYPTGIGALLVRKSALTLLRDNKPFFAGGTVRYVSNSTNSHILHHDYQALEEGTVNFASMSAVTNGLDFLDQVGMSHIHAYVGYLTRRLLAGLITMRWSNGMTKCRLYGPRVDFMRGGTIAFDIILPDGQRADARKMEMEASKHGISLRTGCFCNPGAGEAALQLREFMRRNKCLVKLGESADMDSVSQCAGVPFLGCARVSVGLSNSEKDLDIFLCFIDEYSDRLVESHAGSSNFTTDEQDAKFKLVKPIVVDMDELDDTDGSNVTDTESNRSAESEDQTVSRTGVRDIRHKGKRSVQSRLVSALSHHQH